MIHLIGPGSGISPLGASLTMLGALRNDPAEMRALLKAKGHTALGDTGTITARAVAQVQATDATGPAELRKGDQASTADPLLTGPRPTFAKTPLEKMRTDALSGLPDPIAAPPQTNPKEDSRARPLDTAPEETDQPLPLSPQSAYDGLRNIDAAKAISGRLNITS